MELKDSTYWVVHLKNGVSLYTATEFSIADEPANPGSSRSIKGLDGEIYEFPQDAVLLVHRSTPESRAFYVQLTVGINEEMMQVKQDMLKREMEKEQLKGTAQSAVDRVTRGINRPRVVRPDA